MAKYKGREVSIVSYPEEELHIVIFQDGTNETVPLSEVTLNNQEAREFIKSEQKKLEDKRLADEASNKAAEPKSKAAF